MAYELTQEIETPKKSLSIKRMKFHIPKSDYHQLIVILLIILDALSIIFAKTIEPGVTGVLIAMLVVYLVEKREKINNSVLDEAKNEVKVVDIPQV